LKQKIGGGKNCVEDDSKIIEQACAPSRKNEARRAAARRISRAAGFFQRGQPLNIVVQASKFSGVRLRYRRVNQAEDWR